MRMSAATFGRSEMVASGKATPLESWRLRNLHSANTYTTHPVTKVAICSPAVEATAPRNSPPPSHTNCAHTGFVGVAPALTHSIVLTILESVAPLLARNGDNANAEVNPCAAEVTDNAVVTTPSSEDVTDALTANFAVVTVDELLEGDDGVTLVAGADVAAETIETGWVVPAPEFDDGEMDGTRGSPVTGLVWAAAEVTRGEASTALVETTVVWESRIVSVDNPELSPLTDSDVAVVETRRRVEFSDVVSVAVVLKGGCARHCPKRRSASSIAGDMATKGPFNNGRSTAKQPSLSMVGSPTAARKSCRLVASSSHDGEGVATIIPDLFETLKARALSAPEPATIGQPKAVHRSTLSHTNKEGGEDDEGAVVAIEEDATTAPVRHSATLSIATLDNPPRNTEAVLFPVVPMTPVMKRSDCRLPHTDVRQNDTDASACDAT